MAPPAEKRKKIKTSQEAPEIQADLPSDAAEQRMRPSPLRKISDFTPTGVKKLRHFMRKSKERYRKRRELRKKANQIRGRYNILTMIEVPQEKWEKLSAACGDNLIYEDSDDSSEEIEDMDDDDFFKQAEKSKEEEYFLDVRAKPVAHPLRFTASSVRTFLRFITEDIIVSKFLRYDYCLRLSDKYLLAMTFIYFQRARIPVYSRDPFFKLLFLANETEEDEEDLRYEILAWAYGEQWMCYYGEFLQEKDQLWTMLNYETLVLRETFEQIFQVERNHPVWARKRAHYHAGATRFYIREDVETLPKGPFKTPVYCKSCVEKLNPGALPTKFQNANRSALKRVLFPVKNAQETDENQLPYEGEKEEESVTPDENGSQEPASTCFNISSGSEEIYVVD